METPLGLVMAAALSAARAAALSAAIQEAAKIRQYNKLCAQFGMKSKYDVPEAASGSAPTLAAPPPPAAAAAASAVPMDSAAPPSADGFTKVSSKARLVTSVAS